MTISEQNKQNISNCIDKLGKLLDSDAYMEMVNNLDTPPETRKFLNGLWDKRNKFVLALFEIYASEIKENDEKFRALVSKMEKVREEAEKASDGLKKIADRIEFAVEMAKAVDDALKIAASLLDAFV